MRRMETVSATNLRLFANALDRLGVDAGEVLRRCGISPAALGDPEARIPRPEFDRVWTAASEVSGDPCIGLHAGEHLQPRAINVLGYLMLSSETLGAGVRRVVRYQLALSDVPFLSIAEEEDRVRIRLGAADVPPQTRAIQSEFLSATVLQWTSWVSETRVEPIEARFEHEPRCDASEYQRVLHCPVRFGAKCNEVVLSVATLERPSVHANPQIAALHEEYAARLLGSRENVSIAGRVRRKLAEELESGNAELPRIARRMGMSARSLQRRLADENTSFREIQDRLRRELASEHLERQDTPLAEIAYLTGFSDVSAFTRAVRRWFDRTPGELRGGREGTGGQAA